MDENENDPPKEAAPESREVAPPSINRTAFSCPHCAAYTHQYWYSLYALGLDKDKTPFIPAPDFEERIDANRDLEPEIRERWIQLFNKYLTGKIFFEKGETKYPDIEACNLSISKCFTCYGIAVWVYDRLLYPSTRTGPTPNSDLPEKIKSTYEEAREILTLSPRGAAALLRLCIQNLCIHLGENGKSIDDDIGSLVAKGLDRRVQQALDVVRVIGNNAIHPGQIDLEDDQDTATNLFGLVNLIAEKMISEPKHVGDMFEALPQRQKDHIQDRDKGKP